MPKKLSSPSSSADRTSPPEKSSQEVDFNIQQEFNRVEETILSSPRIPFTRRTLVDEDKLLNQLDLVRINLPEAFEKALTIVQQKQEILQDAQSYAQNLIKTAQNQAAQLLDSSEIVRRAELEANQIRQKVQQDCETLQRKTFAEIEQKRRSTYQELEQMRQAALAECEEIQNGADHYADAALERIEQQLGDMLKVIRNGRQQIHQHSSHKRATSVPPRVQLDKGKKVKQNERSIKS
ncbi:MAG: DivIVA domain-containing protein [Cyanophyceae cyanobacterium]